MAIVTKQDLCTLFKRINVQLTLYFHSIQLESEEIAESMKRLHKVKVNESSNLSKVYEISPKRRNGFKRRQRDAGGWEELRGEGDEETSKETRTNQETEAKERRRRRYAAVPGKETSLFFTFYFQMEQEE